MSVTVASFKAFFDRGEFSYGNVLPTVRDSDITRAITDATARYNPDLYPDATVQDEALTWLSAHELQLRLDISSSGAQPKMLQSSRGADGVSETLAIPEWMLKGDFAYYATTYYGQRFLIISKPFTIGAVLSVSGGTQP